MWDLETLIRMNDEEVERRERASRERAQDRARIRAMIKKGLIAQSDAEAFDRDHPDQFDREGVDD